MLKALAAVTTLGTIILGAPLAVQAQTNTQTFKGNGGTGFSSPGTLGSGSLVVSSTVGTPSVTFTFNPGSPFTGNDVVIYIDNGAAGGYANTSTFVDVGDAGRESISGYNDGKPVAGAANANGGSPTRTEVNFASGFTATEALEFQSSVYIGLFGVPTAGNTYLTYITGVKPTSGGPYTITLTDAQLGVKPGQTIHFVATLISTTAFRSNESIGDIGTVTNPGFNGPITFKDSKAYTIATAP